MRLSLLRKKDALTNVSLCCPSLISLVQDDVLIKEVEAVVESGKG